MTVLAPEIAQLTQLTDLALSDNQLMVLPPEIGKLTKLTRLILDSNKLTDLPPEMALLVNLEEPDIYQEYGLHLYDNPLKSPLPKIIGQGTKAIFAYLKTQL